MKDHQESRTFIHGDEGRRGAARSGTSGVGLSKMTKALRPKRPAPDRALRRTGGKARLVRFERDA